MPFNASPGQRLFVGHDRIRRAAEQNHADGQGPSHQAGNGGAPASAPDGIPLSAAPEDLPGKPDIVFGPRRKVIFVHGCFWHGHDCKRGKRMPATNVEYWRAKIARNVERHGRQLAALEADGWSALKLWE